MEVFGICVAVGILDGAALITWSYKTALEGIS